MAEIWLSIRDEVPGLLLAYLSDVWVAPMELLN